MNVPGIQRPDGVALAYDETGTLSHYEKTGGIREAQTLTIGAPASGSETVTVTLNGTGTNVSVTSGTAASSTEITIDLGVVEDR